MPSPPEPEAPTPEAPTPKGSDPVVERRSVQGLTQLFRHTAMYSMVPILGRAIGFVMVFVFARFLNEREFGAVDLADLLLASLVQILGYNLLSGMTRHYFDHEREEDRAKVVSGVTLLIGVLSWTVVGVMVLFRDELAPILISSENSEGSWTISRLVLIALLTIPFQLCSQCGLYYLQILKRSGTFALIQLIKLVFELSLRIILVLVLDWGPIGMLMPILVGEALLTLFITGWTLTRVGLQFSWAHLRPIVIYSLPLIPVGLFQLLLHYGDRRLLELLVPEDGSAEHFVHYGDGLAQVGIYGVGYKIGFVVTAALLGPFVQIFHPWIYDVKDPEEQANNLSRVSTYGILAMTIASLGVVLISREVLYFMPDGRKYVFAWKVIPFISAGYLFWSLYHLTQIPLYIAKRTKPLVWINGIAVIVNVALNFALVPKFGFIGSGLATLLTFGFLALLGLLAAKSVMSIHFEYRRLGLCFLMMGLACALTLELDRRFPPHEVSVLAVAVAVKLAIFAVLSFVLYKGVLGLDDRQRLHGALRARLGRSPAA